MTGTLDPQQFAQLPLHIALHYSNIDTASGLPDPQTPQYCFQTTSCFAELPSAQRALRQQLQDTATHLRASGRHLCGGGLPPQHSDAQSDAYPVGHFLRLRMSLPEGLGRTRLIRAFQDLLPLLPALTAASPVHQQHLSGWQATALYLRLHAPDRCCWCTGEAAVSAGSSGRRS